MSAKQKNLLLVFVLIAALVVGAAAVSAQDTDTQDDPPFGMMGRGGYGTMMGMGFGHPMMWDEDAAPMFTNFAEALGIDEETLLAELQSGKTLAQLADEQGVDLTALWEAAHTDVQTHLQGLVEAGLLTQEQADARLGYMQSHWEDMPMWDDMPMFTGQGFGMMNGMGMMGSNMHHGMMGRWH